MDEPCSNTNVAARRESESGAGSGSGSDADPASFHAARNALFRMMLQLRRLSSGHVDAAAQPLLRALANGMLQMAALLDELEDGAPVEAHSH